MQSSNYRSLAVCMAIVLSVGCRYDPTVESAADRPVRIVSLAPSLTEMVCAVGGGDLLVGRTSACDYPPEIVRDITVIGEFGVPSLELIAAAEATLVLDVALADETVAERMQSLGIARRRIKCRSLEDIPRALREIGDICGNSRQAAALARRIETSVSRLRNQNADLSNRPTVYAEIWHDPATTAGRGTFLSQLISLAGGSNLGDIVKDGYFQVSHETVLAADPDVVLCLYMSQGNGAALSLAKRPGWSELKAVKTGAIHNDLDNDVILRPGPRVLDGVVSLRRCIKGTAGNK